MIRTEPGAKLFEMKSKISDLRLLVVGDVIIDETVNVSVSRVSPEAPVVVANFIEDNLEAGGAANVALNVISTGAHCALLGFVGDDEKGTAVVEMLVDSNVENLIIELPSVPSILKTRIRCGNTQLIRLDRDVRYDEYELKIVSALEKCVVNFDAIIVSDYGKGSVTEFVFQEIVKLSVKHKFKVFVDPKGARPEKYCGATTITPNRKEFEIFVGEAATFEIIASKGRDLIKLLNLDFLLVTLSELGMLLVYKDGHFEHIPTTAREIYDVTGAGDTVIAIFATLCTFSDDPVLSAKIANAAAGIVVGRSGAAKLSAYDFESIIDEPKTTNISSLNELKKHRTNLGKIVMTNGCFDLLHKGHVKYLNKAKSLGDTLIVALNSDRSVALLKGANRPIHNVEDRACMLKNLKSVDFVVTFDEQTPIEVFKEIVPDILVKGSDYNLEEVVGKNLVEKNGGHVVLIDYLEGYSSTQLIDRIKSITEGC